MLLSSGLKYVVEAYEDGKLENEKVLSSFKKSLFKQFVEYIISQEPALIRI